MKQTTLVTTMALASLVSFGAVASSGTVTFNGKVTDVTCKINGGNGDLTVTLPTVPTSALASAGDVAGATNFTCQRSLKSDPLF